MPIQNPKDYPEYEPCPFCAGTHFNDVVIYWEGEDHQAVECQDCGATARAVIWNNREVFS